MARSSLLSFVQTESRLVTQSCICSAAYFGYRRRLIYVSLVVLHRTSVASFFHGSDALLWG